VSNRRKLRPHEVARRDQRLAEMKDEGRRGTLVIWEDVPLADLQCSWCDCQDWLSPSSPHSQPGYVCPFPCPAMSVTVTWWVHPDLGPGKPIPLCQRHRDGDYYDFLAARFPDLEVLEPWADDDLEVP
jgi:hypothetical protein